MGYPKYSTNRTENQAIVGNEDKFGVIRAEKTSFVQKWLRKREKSTIISHNEQAAVDGASAAARIGESQTIPMNERKKFTMKKWIALALALVTVAFGSLAMAEEVPAADAAQDAAALEELKAEGQLIQGESFEFYIPADWQDVELTDEQAEAGCLYAAASADGAQNLAVYWSELEAAQTTEELQAMLVTVYENAQVQEVNGMSVVVFADAENDTLGIVMPDSVDAGYYMFIFAPASDEAFLPVADAIASSLTPITAK